MANPGYDVPPEFLDDEKLHRRLVARAVRLLLGGKANVVIDITLAAGATSTVVEDPRLHPFCTLGFEPTSASAAAAAAAGIWTSDKTNGSVVVHHPSAAAIDQTFRLAILG